MARVSEMEAAVERSGAEAERVKTELAAAKEQLGQAAGAAGEAERARQAASGEADRAREELVAAKIEIERFKTANAGLEKQIASWHRDSKSATEAARDNMVLMEKTIEELKAALGVARPEEPAPALTPQAKPDVGAEAPAAGSPPPAAKAQSPAPGPAREIGAGQPSRSPTKLSDTELSEWRANILSR